jgi:hypothetical protein
MQFSNDRAEPGPSHWIIIDPRPPGYIGQEIVDLSPGAIELRHVARHHVRDLSFGVRVMYGVDYDAETDIFEGRPIRHLAVDGAKRAPTPATIGEIATFFWGRRAAQMRIADSGLAHIVVGMDWEQLDPRQLVRLL